MSIYVKLAKNKNDIRYNQFLYLCNQIKAPWHVYVYFLLDAPNHPQRPPTTSSPKILLTPN